MSQGLAAAYDGVSRLAQWRGSAPVIDGYTGDQRFFIGYAQIWATKMRDESSAQEDCYRRPCAWTIPRFDRPQY